MSRGFRALLESAAPTLLLAIAVLIAGVGYGVYERTQNSAEVSAAAAEEGAGK